jgi:hypothetical protein
VTAAVSGVIGSIVMGQERPRLLASAMRAAATKDGKVAGAGDGAGAAAAGAIGADAATIRENKAGAMSSSSLSSSLTETGV